MGNVCVNKKNNMRRTLRQPSVTVALSAFNEARNIKRLLKSILSQQEKGFSLKQIWVYCDGSTDSTVRQIRSLKARKIKVYHGEKRMGKSVRLNQIYQRLKTDILVQT